MIHNTSAMDRPVAGRRSRRNVILALAIGAVVVLAALVYPTLSRWITAEQSVALSRIRVGEVVRGDLERDLSVQGRIVAAFHPTLFSPASGMIGLKVQAGEVVEQDQVLAVVDSPELRSTLKQEESTLQSLASAVERQKITKKQRLLERKQSIDLALVEMEAARRAQKRAERSRAEGIINDVDYETAQDDLRRAELALQQAQENIRLDEETLEFEVRNRELELDRQSLRVAELRRQVAELAIRAPVAGLVSRLDVEDHDALTPGQPVLAVVDLSAFEIEVMIPESYADDIALGTPAEINYAGQRYPGKVRIVSPEVQGSQVRGVVVFEGEDIPQGLRQNQRVSTRLILEHRPGVLKVPRGPFLEASAGRQVYRIDGNLAILQAVEVGVTSIGEIEVVSGLSEGDQIIISDTTRFQDAERLFLRD